MNKTEKYLKKLINEIPVPHQSLRYPILSQCPPVIHDNKSFIKKPKYRLPLKYITVFVCLLFIVVSLPVMARIPFVTERMLNLSHEEMTELANMTNQQNTETDLFSRPFTSQERSRMISLRQAYINGDFPESDIPIISGNEAANDIFCYNSETGMFFLPENRELTDEELKQYIDFYYKRDFSLQARQPHENLKSESTQHDAADIDIPKQHREIIANWITVFGLYDFNPNHLTLHEIISSADYEYNYLYTYQNNDTIFSFTIAEDRLMAASTDETGIAQPITDPDSHSINKMKPLKAANDYQNIKETLENAEGAGCTITSAWYLCAADSNDNLYEPCYSYMFEVNDDDNCWLVSYQYGSAYPYRIWKTTTSWYFDNLERGKNINALKGITQEVFSLDSETGQITSKNES